MRASAPLPDAPPDNWVDRRAPEALRPWLTLGRFDRPIGIWLLMLPGWQGIALASGIPMPWWGSPGLHAGWLLLIFSIGACLMRSAGCAWNDVLDRDLDRRVARTAQRPVASGRVSRLAAIGFTTCCTLLAAGLLLLLPVAVLVLAVLSLVLVAAYPLMKRITWWPQAWLGLTFNWGALMGATAAAGGAPFAVWLHACMSPNEFCPIDHHSTGLPHAAGLLYLSGVFWTLGYDTIYAAQDIEDDALVGVKSSARRMGARAPLGVAAFYVVAAGLAGWAGYVAALGPLFWAGLAAYALHLGWQARRFRLGDPALALRLFKSNREAGLILFLALFAGLWRP